MRTTSFQVFTSIFTFECIVKLMALSKDFFLCGWNIFDLIIVSASLVDIIFELVDGLSVLRGLRLVFAFAYDLHTHFKPILFDIKASSAEAGSVVDNNEGATQHHHLDDWRPGKPDADPGDCHLHLCRYRNAVVLQRLYAG